MKKIVIIALMVLACSLTVNAEEMVRCYSCHSTFEAPEESGSPCPVCGELHPYYEPVEGDVEVETLEVVEEVVEINPPAKINCMYFANTWFKRLWIK